jgi:Zn-dependent protease with chaperone function
MQLVLIVIFAALLSLPGRNLFVPISHAATGAMASLAIALTLTLLIPLAAGLGSWACLRRLRTPGGFAQAAILFGRIHLGMRIAVLGLFALLVFETGWVQLVRTTWHLARYPLVGELVLVAPVLVAAVLCWLAMYPTDRALRVSAGTGPASAACSAVWTVWQYLDFQVRYQILTVLVPMSLFVLAFDLMGLYGRRLVALAGFVWVPELVLAVVAGSIFLASPVMLRHLWRTQRLAPSPLRSRLEETCRQMGLRYREILVWKSRGAMVNAAVMGLLPPLRYILLSDGLLDHLDGEQVEAVFGHEAGHVKERHITWYMLFAIASMLAVSLAGDWMDFDLHVPREVVDGAVLGMIAAMWIFAFGWISRRFERQADLDGVRCLNYRADRCTLPCWLHNITPAPPTGRPLCTTAATTFSSALEAVAALNGISKYARSWRHSSIASRQDFVRQAAFYPETLRRFERAIRWIKVCLLGITLALGAVSAWFYWPILFPQPHRRPDRPQYRSGPSLLVGARPQDTGKAVAYDRGASVPTAVPPQRFDAFLVWRPCS